MCSQRICKVAPLGVAGGVGTNAVSVVASVLSKRATSAPFEASSSRTYSPWNRPNVPPSAEAIDEDGAAARTLADREDDVAEGV